VITDYIVMIVLFIIAGVGYEGDVRCYRHWKGIHYKNLVISFAVPVEIVGISGVLVYVLLVDSIAKIAWIAVCVLCLGILAYEIWKVRR
jgi:uncharacterized membrane protein YjfL (UPF0719 family)